MFDKDGLHKLKTSKEGNHGNTKTPSPTPHLATTDWWQLGQDDLHKYLALQPQTGVAKNVIMFVGDGMGITTETVTRFYMAQTQNKQIFDAKFSWDDMPYTGLSKVSPLHSVNLMFTTQPRQIFLYYKVWVLGIIIEL